jgi:hypothetical protein
VFRAFHAALNQLGVWNSQTSALNRIIDQISLFGFQLPGNDSYHLTLVLGVGLFVRLVLLSLQDVFDFFEPPSEDLGGFRHRFKLRQKLRLQVLRRLTRSEGKVRGSG